MIQSKLVSVHTVSWNGVKQTKVPYKNLNQRRFRFEKRIYPFKSRNSFVHLILSFLPTSMILHYRQQRSFHRAFSRKKKTNPSGVPSYTIHLEDEINIRAEKHVGRCWTKILSFSVREPRPPQREGALILHYIISRIVSGVDARSRGTCAHMVSCRAQGEAPLLMQNREEEGGTIPLIVGRIFKFESRISLGPPAMGHRSQSIRGESLSLSLCPPRVTKNRIRAAIEPSSLSFSPPPQPGMHLHAKKHRCRRIEKGFSLLSDARQLERILDSREGNSMHSSNSKRMKFRVVLEITTIFSLFNKIYLT